MQHKGRYVASRAILGTLETISMKGLPLLWFVPILCARTDIEQWTWRDADHNPRTRAELDAVLEADDKWLSMNAIIAETGGPPLA